MSPLISSVAWVRRGAAAENPDKYNLDEKELERVQKLARIELEDAQVELQRASQAAREMENRSDEEGSDIDEDNDDNDSWEDVSDNDRMDEDGIEPEPESKPKKSNSKPKPDDPDGLAEYNLDNYDEEKTGAASGVFSNIKGLTYYRSNDEDPYITLKEDDEQAEREELQVLPTDNMIVTAKTEDEVSHLEVYIYNDADENLYVHHDILLPSFPLCLEWLDFPPPPPTSTDSETTSAPAAQQGNFIAVGTFEPEIEVWSLDVTEAIYPSLILGRPDKSASHVPVPLGTGKKKRKQTKAREPTAEYHVDAVLGLAWNRAHRNILASASADATVKIWDLSGGGGKALRSYNVHGDKVQSVQWNAAQPEVLLTGSYDHTVRVFDSRDPGKAVGAVISSDVEALRWDPWEAMSFYVSLEDGNVHYFDARTLSVLPASLPAPTKSRFTLSAHTGAASALDINPHVRGCIATGGADKLVKVWNVEADGEKVNASMVISRNLEVARQSLYRRVLTRRPTDVGRGGFQGQTPGLGYRC
ncbi:putative WD repeat-containing protein C17D11,16 [Schizosaccharomyces pombe 972h-] [Rhizoctonia solani]|uniref:Putative WD repeat-containing protein C17D11,16 [Schizosaccharomyces pombe 972h-] n=1 Tax=Rhizoctonia solani TaxID=456999 RepID=A0A0K6FQG8_9AGAM|nr:putative WD repeat-containing protein C17D11,16 [Schizosaccharomyces pombe 972h-] [Rhizoctonia solani]